MKKTWRYSIVLFLLPLCAAIGGETRDRATQLDRGMAEDFALYAMMASNAYLAPDRTYFPVERLGWIRVDRNGTPTENHSFSGILSNLQFDIWEHRTEPKTVFSFKGTDEKLDGCGSI